MKKKKAKSVKRLGSCLWREPFRSEGNTDNLDVNCEVISVLSTNGLVVLWQNYIKLRQVKMKIDQALVDHQLIGCWSTGCVSRHGAVSTKMGEEEAASVHQGHADVLCFAGNSRPRFVAHFLFGIRSRWPLQMLSKAWPSAEHDIVIQSLQLPIFIAHDYHKYRVLWKYSSLCAHSF